MSQNLHHKLLRNGWKLQLNRCTGAHNPSGIFLIHALLFWRQNSELRTFFPPFCLLCIISLWIFFFFFNYSYYFHSLRSSFCPLTLIIIRLHREKNKKTNNTALRPRLNSADFNFDTRSLEHFPRRTQHDWPRYRTGLAMLFPLGRRETNKFTAPYFTSSLTQSLPCAERAPRYTILNQPKGESHS